MMKNIIKTNKFICLLLGLVIMPLSAQTIKPLKIGNTSKKTVEPVSIFYGQHNIASKTKLHRLLFPSYNAKLEFFVDDSQLGPTGFKLDDSIDINSISLTVLWVSNWTEVEKDLEAELPLKSFKGGLRSRSKKELEEAGKFNKKQVNKRRAIAMERYQIDSTTVLVSRDFANHLYNKVVDLLYNHVEQEQHVKSYGGYISTFRCVVDDEVWTLSGKPYSATFKDLTEICYQVAKEIRDNGKLDDEGVYLSNRNWFRRN